MKPELLAARYEPILPLMRCPLCEKKLSISRGSLLCEQGHCFDFSKYSYVNLVPSHHQEGEKYGAALFDSRKKILEAGFYQPIVEAAEKILREAFPSGYFSLLDVGCGEGYYTRALRKFFPDATLLGMDLSRDAITAAAKAEKNAAWFIGDLKHLPIRDERIDVILDVLTPADYTEFSRILKKDGILIKMIPGENYLCEIREAVAPWLKSGAVYDNGRVLEHLANNTVLLQEQTVLHTSALTTELSDAFLRMTPMTFSVPEEALQSIHLDRITIEMKVVLSKFNK